MDQHQLLATAFKMTVGLGIVLLIFGGALLIARRFAGTSSNFLKKSGKGKPMEVLAFQSLGPGRSLYLVRCLNKKVLVGATNHGINHITDMEDDDDSDKVATNNFSFKLEEKLGEDDGKSLKQDIKKNLREIARV
jgi:flagellar protein FliO/FliZ